jgi:uncharacterized DUF497 family protein
MKTTFYYACHFSWFVDKDLSNMRKHGIAFEDALEAFMDPLGAIRPDSGLCPGEERWLVLGMLRDRTLAVVAHTYEELDDLSHVRIISARKATKRERLEYETGIYSVREASPAGEYNMSERDDDGVCAEYDFSNAVRGKYYRPNMVISFPIYLDEDVLAHFRSLAQDRGIETRELLNEILRRQMRALGESGVAERT